MKRIGQLAVRIVCISLATMLSACSQPGPKGTSECDVASERSAIPSILGSWDVAGDSELVLEDRSLRLAGPSHSVLLAGEINGNPSIDVEGKRVAFSHRIAGSHGSGISVIEFDGAGWSELRLIVHEGTPDRVAISPDGKQIVYVAPANGVASIWIVPFEGGDPVQIINVDMEKHGLGEPAGFVPVPHREPPRFKGDKIVWDSPRGSHEAVLP